MIAETRRIYKSAVTSQNLIRELLQLMFVSELVAPGEDRAWLVSPWISNIVLFDNRAGGFGAVNPEWGCREIRLAEIAVDLMTRGTPLGIATNFDAHNDGFLFTIAEAAEQAGVKEKLIITRRERLHTKGILLRKGLLTGSMNLTYNGLELNDETVIFDTSSQAISQAQVNFMPYEKAEA